MDKKMYILAVVFLMALVSFLVGGCSNTSTESASLSSQADVTRDEGNNQANDTMTSLQTDSIDSLAQAELVPMESPEFKSATRKAIIIAVGKYPQSGDKKMDWGRINSEKDLELLTPLLTDVGFTVTPILENDAKHDAIIKKLKNFSCHPGDTVLVHFSGHGQRMADTIGDEFDHYTETFIPFDAKRSYSESGENKYTGENHLTDDQINDCLLVISKKIGEKGLLMVTIDACFSGGGSRAQSDNSIEDTDVIRGTLDIFGNFEKTTYNEALVKKRKVPEMYTNFHSLSACSSEEKNHEYKGHGSLSWAMSLVLKDVRNGKVSLDRFLDAVKNHSFWETDHKNKQTPSDGADYL